MTDRGIQLETPRPYFLTPFTPNAAFYVRYHLDLIPNAVDLSTWRLSLEGNVERPLQLSFDELVKNFKAGSVAAVNQCSGNSRSRFQPRVPGAQWGNGGMGNARWTGVRLRELLASVGIKSGTAQLQFQGLDRSGDGPVMKVEFSEDDGRNWVEATLGADHGPYSFRTWAHTWRPSRARKHVIAVRATDAKGNIQPDAPVWNPGGYLWNRVERQALIVGAAS